MDNNQNSNLLIKNHIILDSQSKTQKDAFIEFSNLARTLNLIKDSNELVKAFEKRESISSTGFEDGIAIPHAQNDCVIKPAVLVSRYNSGIEWNSIDKSGVKIAIAIILPKDKASELQIDILKNIALKLLDKKFVEEIKKTNDKDWIIKSLSLNNIVKSENQNIEVETDSNSSQIDNNQKRKTIVGVSGCTTGIAHTYMCKELLEKEGKKLGYDVHIECQGQRGKEYPLTKEEIDNADLIIHALDIGIDLVPFAGKIVYKVGTHEVVKNPMKIIQDAEKFKKFKEYQSANPEEFKKGKKSKKVTSENQADFIQAAGKGKPQVLKHILSGCSYLIPFVVFAGLTYSIITGISKATFGSGFAFSKDGVNWDDIVNLGNLAKWGATKNLYDLGLAHVLFVFNNIATLGFEFMIPVMAAYIGFSIAGRAAMVSCFVTAFLLTQPGELYWWDWGHTFSLTGDSTASNFSGYSWTLFGGLYAGFMGGYVTKGLLKIKVASWFAPVMPMVIIPFLSTLLTAIPVAFLLAAPVGWVMGQFNHGMSYLAKHPQFGFLVGILVGAMVGFDLGGPINKIAVLTATALISAPGASTGDGGLLMGSVGAAIPIAPMGSGLASILFGRKMFNRGEKAAGYNALLLGFMGISESGIPFLVRDTWRNMVPNLIGSAVAGALAYSFGVADRVGAYGSFIVGFLGGVSSATSSSYFPSVFLYFLAMVIGILVHSIIYTTLLAQKEGKLNLVLYFSKIFKKSKNIDIKKNQN